jgi:four helix bundle protein
MQDLKTRYKKSAIDVASLIQKLPKNTINIAYCNQLIRSSSSPGTNYRAALRGKSTADFINKLKIVEEELDESIYFLELLLYFNDAFKEEIEKLMKEGNELLAITVKSIQTSRSKLRTSSFVPRTPS